MDRLDVGGPETEGGRFVDWHAPSFLPSLFNSSVSILCSVDCFLSLLPLSQLGTHTVYIICPPQLFFCSGIRNVVPITHIAHDFHTVDFIR